MDTILVMAAGVAVGRFFPAKYRKQNEWVQLACTLLLIFSMGLGLGQQPDFFSDLAALGLSSLLFFLLPTAGSVAAVWLLTRRRGGPAHGRPSPAAQPESGAPQPESGAPRPESGAPRPESGAPRPRVGDPMMFFALGAVGLGLVCGAVSPLAAALAPVRDGAQWILYLLMFCVGISVGGQRGVLVSLRRHSAQILLVPLGVIVGSLAGGGLCGLLLRMPLREALSIGGGLGWYSLAGVSVSSAAGVTVGSIAFLSNLLREIGAFLLIPLVARRVNAYACIAVAGATSEDTTLPMILRYTDGETAVLSVLNGVICSAFVPVLLSLCY